MAAHCPPRPALKARPSLQWPPGSARHHPHTPSSEPRSRTAGALRAQAAGGRAAGGGDKGRPTCAGARAREVTSGARRQERGPAKAAGHAPSGRAPSTGAGLQGRLALPFRSAWICICMKGRVRFYPEAPRPRPRPRLPRRSLQPPPGAPGFRLGEGVSTWSGLKNVSLPLLHPLTPTPGWGGVSFPRNGGGVRSGATRLLPPGQVRRDPG